MKLTKQRLKEIIREELAEAMLDEKNYYPTGYGTDPTRRDRTPEERERDRRERERQNQDYIHRHGKKPFGSRGTHLEEDGASPLPDTRVELRGSKGKKKGYWTSRDLHGDKNYVMVKWDGDKGQSRVEKHLLDTIKE